MAGYQAKVCCLLLGVSSLGYYKHKNRVLISDVDEPAMADRTDPRGSYGFPANLRFPARARGAHPRDGYAWCPFGPGGVA